MRNIIKDIRLNCPECCDPEQTIKFLYNKGDLSFTSEHYREVWFFYLELGKQVSKREARFTTLELFRIKIDKFKYIQRWAKRANMKLT
ncbi:MAG: hypothetical protein O2887_10320 [Bacteroidetes bacterium]|nr:hypothetical protein [Bacteroidota bacterium]